ncbi:MAG TPA: hypothetical protein VFJ62_13235 [Usitatibacter sp.]|nr:hypothetical protein [Usitatibacter sp.]
MNLDFACIVATSFLASAAGAVAAATVVLATGIARGWRPALGGACAGAAVLAAIVFVAGSIIASAPLGAMHVITGTLLLFLGIRWLREAILRHAGVIAMRDEEAAFERERQRLGAERRPATAALGAFKAILLGGLEAVMVVMGMGAARHMLVPASMAALAACGIVATGAAILRRPLARVPQNASKLVVGIAASAYGLYEYGEGVGVTWPLGQAAFPALVTMLLVASVAGVRLARERAAA